MMMTSFDWILEIRNEPGNLLSAKNEIVQFCHRMRGVRLSKEDVAPFVGAAVWEGRRVRFLESIRRAGLRT